ncbi:hypothetical protein QCD79_05935 [Pseudomonas quasicaspiana]|nr:hypothetical protein [Pseudomonas quasicaspiana]
MNRFIPLKSNNTDSPVMHIAARRLWIFCLPVPTGVSVWRAICWRRWTVPMTAICVASPMPR